MKNLKDEIMNYISDYYNASPEYLWARYPDYAVFRHSDNRKWFAIVMAVSREKLGLSGNEKVDIINLKMNDLFTADFLVSQPGIFGGYHMSRGKWVSVLLDGTVQKENITALIEESFRATAKKIKRARKE